MLDIKKNISLSNYTTFRIGGLAKFFVEVDSENDLFEALHYAKKNNLNFFILGGGSNLLVSDNGYDGLVIKCRLVDFSLYSTANSLKVAAGVPLAMVVNLAARHGLSGMEWAAGIPGTVGGAVRGNTGAFGMCMADVIKNVRVLKIPKIDADILNFSIKKDQQNENSKEKELEIMNYDLQDCLFGYRDSIFKRNENLIVLSAVINLSSGDQKEIQLRVKEIINKRISSHPRGGSAGSFFLNPVVTDKKLRYEFEKETGKKPKDERLPAGWLIDQAGLRGKKIGGAMISNEHGNWIINTGQATAEDVIMLASIIKQRVRDKFGIELESEVRYLGL